MALIITSSISPVNPSLLFNEGYITADQNIIPNQQLEGAFDPDFNQIELFIYDSTLNLLDSNYNFNDWSVTLDGEDVSNFKNLKSIYLNPESDLINKDFDTGKFYAVYNFINLELSSSIDNKYYISEISSDRTEIRISTNNISKDIIESTFNDLNQRLNSNEYFDEFYIVFEGNRYLIGVNILLDNGDVLIKLYQPLPLDINLKNELYIVTKIAESVGYDVSFTSLAKEDDDIVYLQGPNVNINVKDYINNSTELKSKNELLRTNSSESLFNLNNILNKEGVGITPNYSYDTFDEFVHFSSAKKRIENFYYKVQQIESYQSDINAVLTITGSTSESLQTTYTIESLNNNINNIIKNFDGYEHYLYYESGSSAYPKSNSTYPYTLKTSNTTDVLEWLGSDVEGSQYYGGILLSASFYDNNNQNYLFYTIPEFIRENRDNDQYIEFSNMVGQFFDEIWLKIKSVSQLSNTTNVLDKGVPLDIIQNTVNSLGFEIFGNGNLDSFTDLVGENSGSLLPPTGSELITDYIAVSQSDIPYPLGNIKKEIYKRLYHNLSNLYKYKGTISGLRQLINIWGIPNTILRINEFGGKDKDNINDYDLWYKRYNQTYTPIKSQTYASSSVRMPWQPLTRNLLNDSEYIVPDAIEFRFKTTGIPTGSFITQSLLVKKSDSDSTSTNFDFGIKLLYTGSSTGSYQGASSNDYEKYGLLNFYISGAAADGGVAVSDNIYLPFYDKGWWSVLLQRNQHVSASDNTNNTTYTLYAKNSIYNGYDGNGLGYQGSASIVSNISESINESWNLFGTSSVDGIYLGGFISGSQVGNEVIGNNIFSGSLQEFRYYANPITELIFNDFVMNPESIEGINGVGSLSSFDILSFRAPLGNLLEYTFTSTNTSYHTQSISSLHPAIGGLLVTSSFIDPTTSITSSNFDLIFYENNTTQSYTIANEEVIFLDQPPIGLRNRISDKIKVDEGSYYGDILSNQFSIQQDYQISQSYTEDVNRLEVAFSPQDEINDDIIQSLGFNAIPNPLEDYIFSYNSDSTYYTGLRELAEDYFKKYNKSNIYDYIRLIKYFDNSLFKAIKSFVPARTNLSTGIVIKQHLLERNKVKQPSISSKDTLATGLYNDPLIYQNLYLTTSIDIESGSTSGGTLGTLDKYNYSGSAPFGSYQITQSWISENITPLGIDNKVEDTQKEFYNGEFEGSTITATTQSVFNNPYKSPTNKTGSLPNTSSIQFYNSIYNALDSVMENRDNIHLMDVDYSTNPNVPVNSVSIALGSATKAQVPDSNYTTTRIIRPRYEGSEVKSADYNFYTSPTSNIIFKNGDTGSWEGDKSYGKTAAIDVNPIYIGYFENSYESFEIKGAYKYNLKFLIEVPFEDISGQVIEPNTIQIDGNNTRTYEVVNTFEKLRDAIVTYNRNFYLGINYKPLTIEDHKILYTATDFDALNSNIKDKSTGTDAFAYVRNNEYSIGSQTTSTIQMVTGSGHFILSGSTMNTPINFYTTSSLGNNSYNSEPVMSLRGPQLGVFHTYNKALYEDQTFTSTPGTDSGSVWVIGGFDNEDPDNYFVWNPLDSNSLVFDSTTEPFLIQPGDIITVEGLIGGPSDREFQQIDFRVTSLETSSYDSGSSNPYTWTGQSGNPFPSSLNDQSVWIDGIWDKVNVEPNPETVLNGLHQGEITRFTIKRRLQSDNNLILKSTIPSGSVGASTKSGGGFIIPKDLTPTQRSNALNIINELRSKNAFSG